jgi:hypothetical protein
MDLAYLSGVYHGDGAINRRRHSFGANITDHDFAVAIKSKMQTFGVAHLHKHKNKITGRKPFYVVEIFGDGFLHIIDFLTFDSFDVCGKFEFLAGLIDSDGSVRFSPKRYQKCVRIHSTNLSLLKKIADFEGSLGIQSTLSVQTSFRNKPLYTLSVVEKNSLRLLHKMVHLHVRRKQLTFDELIRNLDTFLVRIADVDRRTLFDLYVHHGSTADEIAELMGVSKSSILRWLRIFKIGRRPAWIRKKTIL